MSQSSPRVLVVVQHDGTHCSPSTLSTFSAAQQLATLCAKCPIDALLVGYQCQPVCEELQQLGIINQVLLVDDEWYVHPLSERIAPVVAEVSQRYSHVLSSATTFGKDLMPRVAALLDVGQLSDITAIESADTIIRPVYAGNAYARVQSSDSIKVMTVRESAFDNIQPTEGSTTVTRLQRVNSPISTEFVGQIMTESARPDLTSAKVVVSGGRGLGSKEHFTLVETLADKLGGAIGASRAAVDAGFVPNDLQVGQTGKVVAPELYIAVGISGAIQHIAGMKESKVIVAINSDPDAPIFEVADYGLVGDLFTIVPELIENL